jgi:voltage-gated potassium channel
MLPLNPLRQSLYKAFYKPTTVSYGLIFQLLIFVNIFSSIFILFLETEKDLSHYSSVFESINTINLTLFVIEYVLRLYVIKEDKYYLGRMGRMKYALTPLMLIDLIVLLPFLFSFLGVDLSFLRALRSLRIFKLFRMGKFAQFDELIVDILKDKKEEFFVIFMTIFVLLFTVTPLVYYFENPVQPKVFSSMFDTLWWATVTFTTVGYGDMYPISLGGRILTVFITILGISVYAIPGSIFTASLLQHLNEKKEKKRKKKN